MHMQNAQKCAKFMIHVLTINIDFCFVYTDKGQPGQAFKLAHMKLLLKFFFLVGNPMRYAS